jgi:uncharacterized small protein (DUF1192 family)
MALPRGGAGVQYRRQQELPMDEDDRAKKLVAHEVGMPIDTMSVDELEHRIGLLSGEIERLRAAIAARRQTRSAADSLFKL